MSPRDRSERLLEIHLQASGEQTPLQNRGGPVERRAERLHDAENAAAIEQVEHVELSLQPDLSDLELLGQTNVDLVPSLQVLRARREQRYGDARLRERHRGVRRTNNRVRDVVVHVERWIDHAANRWIVHRVLACRSASRAWIPLPASTQLDTVRERIRTRELELRGVRDVQLPLIAEPQAVGIVHFAR